MSKVIELTYAITIKPRNGALENPSEARRLTVPITSVQSPQLETRGPTSFV